MMRQTRSDKTIIAERISILDLVSQYVQLDKAGKYYKGLCPFHQEKTPSFFVNPDRNTFHCYGCGTGGDIYSFFMNFHDVSFPQALQEMARRAGIRLERGIRKRNSQQEEAYQKAVELNRSLCQYYQQNLLKSSDAQIARDYLKKRGIDQQTISDFSLGFAPKAWEGTLRFLTQQQQSTKLAATLGLIMQRKSGRGFYDRFRNRLMFPIMDTTDQILGYGGRTLEEDGPKYMNSPESFLYHKGSALYGLNNAQQSIRERKAAILVEGYFDLITLHQQGFTNAVAVLGTALTSNQIDILKRYTKNFILIFDGDIAGKKASFRNLSDFLEKNISARVVYLPDNEDPDSFLRTEGQGALQKLLEEAPSLLNRFIKEKTQDINKNDSIEKKISVARTLLPVFKKIPDRLEQNLRIKSLADEIGIAELFLREEISKHIKNKVNNKGSSSDKTIQRQASHSWPAEERLISQILMQFPNLLPQFMGTNVLELFRSSALKFVIQAFEHHFNQQDGRNVMDLSEIVPKEDDTNLLHLLTSLSCKEEFTEPEALIALEDGIRRIRERSLKGRLEGLNKKIQEAEKAQETDLQNQLFREMQRLLEEKKALYH